MTSYSGTTFKLNTGASIPAIGFGTWQDKDSQEEAVLTALKAGYRHIDTARIYGTEPAVGKALKNSGVKREDIFVTTKLWNHQHHPDDVPKAMEASLKDLGTDYVDLYLIHWPVAWKRGDEQFPFENEKAVTETDYDFIDTWKAVEKLYKSGKAKAIGVSNFNQSELERVLKEGDVEPAVHQMELNPWLQQSAFVDWHKSKGIHVTAYSPFGNSNQIYDSPQGLGKTIEDPVLVDIGKKHQKSGAQVALAWGVSRGTSVIPKSKTEARIKQNLDSDFKLSEEEVQKISGINKKLRLNDPSDKFGWKFYQGLEGSK